MAIANLERTKVYARAFWEQELVDRPYVCVTAPKKGGVYPQTGVFHNPVTSYTACMSEQYDPLLTTFSAIVDNTYYAGEAVPVFQATLGPDEYAGFLGGKICGEEGADTTWSHPVLESWEGFEGHIDQSPAGYFEKMRRYIDYAARFGEGKFLVSMLDLHSNLDAMSALRGAEDLCYDLMDDPDGVLRALRRIDDTFAPIYDMAYQAGRMDTRGSVGWAPIYCEGRSAVVQCDFSCLISPEQVRTYLIPSLYKETASLDHCIYHYDGKEALGHLEEILAIDAIDCIQWVPGAGQPRTLEWMDLLKHIQQAGKSLWIYDWSAEEIKQLYKELDPAKTAFSLAVGSEEEADELLEYLVRHT